MKRVLAGVLFLFVSLVCPCANSLPEASAAQQPTRNADLSVGQNEGTFLMLSDIHFDPLADIDPKVFAQLNSRPARDWQSIFESSGNKAVHADERDSNYALFASALVAAKDSGRHYDYILVTGDFLAHDFRQKYESYRPDGSGYEKFVVKTIAFVSGMVQQAFPTLPVYNALGNNDSTIGDYSAPGDSLLAGLAKEWKVVANDREATRDFLAGGYYAVPHPVARNAEFIVLDTTLLSARYDTPSIAKGDQGATEMTWLDSKLTQLEAAHKTAILLMHIPPGIDAFQSSKPESCIKPTLLWKGPYLDSFLEIINRHESTLRDAYAGHLHMDDFRVFTDPSGKPFLPMHIAPAAGYEPPNNPSFEIGVYEKSGGALQDYEVITLTNSAAGPDHAADFSWREAYDFRQASGSESFRPETLKAFSEIIRSNDMLRATFLKLFKAQTLRGSSVDLSNWRPFSCAETELTPDQFAACACPVHPKN